MATLISKEYAQDVMEAVMGTIYTGSFSIALLYQTPIPVDGTISLTGTELSGKGYARVNVPVTDFVVDPDKWNPVTAVNQDDIVFAANSHGTNWSPITHAAVIHGSTVLAVISADTPITIKPNRWLRIPAGSLALRMDSV